MSHRTARLAIAMRARRWELKRTVVEIHALTGIARSTWSMIEGGERERLAGKTLHAIDVGLSWQPGTAASLYRRPDTLAWCSECGRPMP